MTLLSIFGIGFSIVTGVVLFFCYSFFLKNVNRDWATLSACALLLGGLSAAQYCHYVFFTGGSDPMDTLFYRFLILMMPSMFFLLSRGILFPDKPTGPVQALHLLPVLLVFFVPRDVAVPIAFTLGMGYAVWLARVIYRVMSYRKRFDVVIWFYGFFAALAVAVLILGFSVNHIDNRWFYYLYSNGITISYAMVIAALVILPGILDDMNDVVRLSYANSTLGSIDIDGCLKRLDELMAQGIYQNEDLNLSLLAESLSLNGHQLSELINTRFDMGFSQYIRQQRIEAAKRLLIDEPKASVLSISMEVGFKSQSNFYAAFKELTGESPGNFRKQQRS